MLLLPMWGLLRREGEEKEVTLYRLLHDWGRGKRERESLPN